MQRSTSWVFRTVCQEVRDRLRTIAVIAALMLIQTGLVIASPLMLGALFDRAIPTADLGYVAVLIVGMAAAPLLAQAVAVLHQQQSATLGANVSVAIRVGIFDRLLGATVPAVESLKSGEIIHRLTRESGSVGQVYLAQEVLPLISSGVLFCGTLAAMVYLEWRLTVLVLVALPLSYLVSTSLSRSAKEADGALIRAAEEGQSYLQEAIAGLRTVHAFGGRDYESGRWRGWNTRYLRAVSRSNLYHTSAFLGLPAGLVNNAFIGLLYGCGALLIIRRGMTVGQVVSLTALVPRLYSAFEAYLRARVGAASIEPALAKLDELAGLPLEPAEPAAETVTKAGAGGMAVGFESVSFGFERGFGVRDVSFLAATGEFVGLVGPSGGGKSTIVDLLLGFYRPDRGRVLIDGVDTSGTGMAWVRRQIGYVPQEVFVWNASIRDNLTYPGRRLSDAEVRRAAALAEVREFIEGLPQGYDTIVGERGLALSVGEKQRLALARALLRDPRLIVLDEATAAMDAITEAKIRRALANIRRDRTVVAIAHRLVTVLDADRVLVVEGGRVVDEGSPAALRSREGLFRRLYLAQSLPDAGEALANG